MRVQFRGRKVDRVIVRRVVWYATFVRGGSGIAFAAERVAESGRWGRRASGGLHRLWPCHMLPEYLPLSSYGEPRAFPSVS